MSLDVQSISLDISKQPTPQQVRLGQGDANATQLIVSVFDDGEVYSLDDYSVRLAMRLPNSDNYYEAQGTASDNVATFEIDETYAATSYGIDGFGYVDVLDGETVICSTSRFQLVVLRDAQDGADPSTAYSNGIIEATERAIAAAEAAEGVVLQDVPTMSATIKGGALLGDGLVVEDEVLSLDLPTMSASTKGGAKLGSGLSVANDTLSLSGESFTSAEKTKLSGIEDGANNYALPTMDSSTKGGAKLGAGLSVSNDVLSVDVSSATGALPIAHGGTGAGTVAGALANLGVAPIAYGMLSGMSSTVNLTTSGQKLPLDTFIGSGCSKSSNGIKVDEAGVYLISAQMYYATGFTVGDLIHTRIIKNETTALSETIGRATAANPYTIYQSGPVIAALAAGDTVYVYAYNQTAARGSAYSYGSGEGNTLALVRIA